MCCIVGETWKVLWWANIYEDTIIGLIQPKHNTKGSKMGHLHNQSYPKNGGIAAIFIMCCIYNLLIFCVCI